MACGCESAKCRLGPGDKRHGSLTGYNRGGCRCSACRDANKAYQKAYYEANRLALREYGKAYREANREATLERQKAYYEANREAEREYKKAYYEANPDVYRACNARRRARKANATIGPDFTRQQVWDRDNGTCHICGKPADPDNWHMDHVVPLAREGAHSFDNCSVSCPPCNLRKGTRLLDELDTA